MSPSGSPVLPPMICRVQVLPPLNETPSISPAGCASVIAIATTLLGFVGLTATASSASLPARTLTSTFAVVPAAVAATPATEPARAIRQALSIASLRADMPPPSVAFSEGSDCRERFLLAAVRHVARELAEDDHAHDHQADDQHADHDVAAFGLDVPEQRERSRSHQPRTLTDAYPVRGECAVDGVSTGGAVREAEQ